METTINVTQRDIKLGKRHSCDECPIARAASRAFHCRVSVDEYEIGVEDEIFTLPLTAKAFIQAYDNWGNVEPFSFTVTAGEK